MESNESSDDERPTEAKRRCKRADQVDVTLNEITTDKTPPQPHSAPQLPLVVLTKVAALLQRDDEGYVFRDRVCLSSVSSQLHHTVFSGVQRTKVRQMVIRPSDDSVCLNGIDVKNILRSSYSQWDCIAALLDFGRPNQLMLEYVGKKRARMFAIPHILTLFSPLTLTHLSVVSELEFCGLDSPLNCNMLKVIGGMVNLEVLSIQTAYMYTAVLQAHQASSPLLPADSPFNQLLTLGKLRALRVDLRGCSFLTDAQMARLLNESPSKITNICRHRISLVGLLGSMEADTRADVEHVCCSLLSPYIEDDNQWRSVLGLPNCRKIYGGWPSYAVGRMEFDRFGRELLDVRCAEDANLETTFEVSIGIDNEDTLQQYAEEGGVMQLEFTRDGTVVRLSIGLQETMKQTHCPFIFKKCCYL